VSRRTLENYLNLNCSYFVNTNILFSHEEVDYFLIAKPGAPVLKSFPLNDHVLVENCFDRFVVIDTLIRIIKLRMS